MPHPPQFELSDCSSTHAVPHGERPDEHVSVHFPLVQTSAPAHCVPQLPQSFWLLERSTHAPPHDVCPAGHAQEPATQLVPDPQTVPQAPQL
jgi:hypothetical protein